MNDAANTDSALGAAAGNMPKAEPKDGDVTDGTGKVVGNINDAGIGHNSGESEADDIGGVAGKRLESFIQRIERMEEEKAGIQQDIKEIYAEAKGVGFDVKTMRDLVKLRKMDAEKRREAEQLLDLYKSAVGIT